MDTKFFLSRRAALNSITQKTKKRKEILSSPEFETVKTGLDKLESGHANQIASFNPAVKELITNLNDSLIVTGGLKQDKKNISKSTDIIGKTVYGRLFENGFFENLSTLTENTKNHQSGSSLFSNIIKIDKINYNMTSKADMIDYSQLYSAVNKAKNIIDSASGHIITYDLETLGGINSFGHQQYDFITELSATVWNGKKEEVENISSILGFTDEEFDRTVDYLNSLRNVNPAEYSSLDKVYVDRLSMYGHKNLKTSISGFEHKIVESADPIEIESTIDNAIEGAKYLRSVQQRQTEYLIANNINESYSSYRRKYIQSYADLVYKGEGVQKYNNFVALGQNNSMFDDTMVSIALGKNIEHVPRTNFDLYQMTKYINENIGSHIPEKMKATNMFGLNTQDQLKYLYSKYSNNFDPSKIAAHNAKEDENTLFKILTDSDFIEGTNYLNFIQAKGKQVYDKLSPLMGEAEDNDLFLMDKTLQKSFSTNKNGLNVTYNPIDKSFKSNDAFRINKSGVVNKESFSGFGPKNNALYTHNVYEVNMTDKWKEMFSNIGISEESIEKYYNEYASLDKMYVLESKEYINKGKIEKRFGKDSIESLSPIYYSFFKSKEELSASMGIKVGKVNKNNSISLNDDAISALNLSVVNKGNEHVVLNKLSKEDTKEMLLDRSLYKTKVDSASRTIRDMDYEKLMKFKKYNEVNHLSISKRISDLVANNQNLDFSIANSLAEELGFYDYASKSMKIYPETIAKASIIDKYVSAMNPFFTAIESVFKEKGLPDSFTVREKDGIKLINSLGNKGIKEKKDWLFKSLLSNYLDEQTDKNPVFKQQIFSEKELFKIDFKTEDVFPDKYKRTFNSSIFNEEYSTLDLTKNDGILNFFYSGYFGKTKLDKKNTNAGFDALLKAYDTFNNDERFSGVWKGFPKSKLYDYQDKGNINQLSTDMTEHLREYVKNRRISDPGFGLLLNRQVQDYSDLDRLKELIGPNSKENVSNIKNWIEQNYNMIDDVVIADTDNKEMIDTIVNKYFMTFSKTDFDKQISKFNEQQQNLFKAQYSLAKESSYKVAEDLVNAIQGRNLNLIVNGTGKDAQLFVKHNSEIQKLDTFKFTLTDGIINYNIGGQNHAMNFEYDTSSIIKWNKKMNYSGSVYNNINFNSNIGAVINRMRTFSDSVKRAEETGSDLLDAFVYTDKRISKTLREVGPRREIYNYNNLIERNTQLNWNALIPILPELKDEGLFSEINKNYKIPEKYQKSMNDIIEKIRKERPNSIKDLLASEQNIVNQIYLNPMLTLINQRISGQVGGQDFSVLTDNISIYLQDTKMDKGKVSVNSEPFSYGFSKTDSTSRSVANQQGNALLYRRDKVLKEIEEQKAKAPTKIKKMLDTLIPGGQAFTKASEALVNDVHGYTAGVTLKYMQMDSDTLREIFTKAGKERFESYAQQFPNAKAADILYEKAKKLSTYQQESVINSRINYMFFSKNNEKLIDAKKELIVTHSKNITTINTVKNAYKLSPIIDKNGHIKYQLGYEVKNGELLGLFGESETKKFARNDGVFRGRYFNEFGVVSETEINNAIEAAIKEGKIRRKEDAILDYVNSIYDFKYQVIDKFESSGHKLYNAGSEKSTVNAMDIALGTLDTSLAAELETRGFGNLRGKYISKEYLEEYLLPSVKDGEALKERILKERFALSDAITELFPEFEDIAQITNVNVAKHQSVSMAMDNLIYKINKLEDKKDYFDALFGKDNYEFSKSGALIIDNVKKIKTKDFDSLTEEQNKILNNILNENDFVKDKSGKTLGHTGYSYVIQAKDDSAGTYSSLGNAGAIRGKLEDVEELIQRAELRGEGNAEATKLLYQKRASLETEFEKLKNEKGLTFDSRMNLILQRQVYDDDAIQLARKKLSPEEFKSSFGHAIDSNGFIKEEYKGKSILAPITKNLNDQVLLSPTDLALANSKGYQHLKSAFSNFENSISVDKAELLYSYLQGKRAIEFNKTPTDSMLSKLVKEGENNFKLVDISKLKKDEAGWLDLDIGGQGKSIVTAENNPYRNNIVLKTGLGGNQEYLAIPRMPEKHYEDMLIKSDHISKLGQLQRTLQDINSGEISDLEGTKNYARSLVEQIKKSQIKDITSKTGIYGELETTRLAQSFFGTASGITISSNAPLGKASYESLQRLNSEWLDSIEFKGKSMLQHYSEGKVYDFVAFSEKAAEKMGYFDEGFMLKTLGPGATKEKMIEMLSTKGDAFLTTRFPRIQEGSDKVVMGYLDTSMKDNQIKAVAHTGLSMNLDHDGDKFAIARLSDSKGYSYLNYLSTGERTEQINAIEAYMTERAVNTNVEWDTQARKQIEKERNVAMAGNRIQDIARDKLIDDELSTIYTSPTKTAQMETLLDKHLDNIKLYQETGDHSSVIDKLKSEYGEGEDFIKAKNEYRKAFEYQQYKDEFIAKSSKASIGEINVSNIKVREITQGLLDKTSDSYNFDTRLMVNMMEISEQAVISAKSSIKGLDPEHAKSWNEHLNELVRNRGNRGEHVSAMKDWAQEYIADDINYSYYWNTSQKFQDIASDVLNEGKSLTKEQFDTLLENPENNRKMQSKLIDNFVDTIDSIRRTDGVETALDYLSIGMSTTGVTKPLNNASYVKAFDSSTARITKAISMTNEIADNINISPIEEKVTKNIDYGEVIDNIVSSSEKVKRSLADEAMEGTADFFKAVKGSNLALGAIGLAASVMTMGYIAGRPHPAEAMEDATEETAPQQQGLIDPNLLQQTSMQNGYVVNINARSEDGKENVQRALQQVLASSVGGQVNMAVNINDNYGNVTDRKIEAITKDLLS